MISACKVTPPVSNASATRENYELTEEGNVVWVDYRYSCFDGYLIKDNSKLRCTYIDGWKTNLPQCLKGRHICYAQAWLVMKH